jgi:flagellar basal-body rod modification protein FlgD
VPLQSGKAKFDYKIEHASGAATLKILDASGNVVMLKQVDAAVGTHPVEWDGTDYFGNQLKDGKYTVAVSYTDQNNGKSYDAPITSYGKVDSATISDGTVYLKMGDVSVALSDVLNISKPTETDSGSDGTDTGSST